MIFNFVSITGGGGGGGPDFMENSLKIMIQYKCIFLHSLSILENCTKTDGTYGTYWKLFNQAFCNPRFNSQKESFCENKNAIPSNLP